jgi:hypothetical protein
MHYNSLLVTLTLASTMASVTSAGVVQKRFCNDGRQFCCAVEEVPDAEILPNLYLFVYGIGCSKLNKFLKHTMLVTDPRSQRRFLSMRTATRRRLSPTACAAELLILKYAIFPSTFPLK